MNIALKLNIHSAVKVLITSRKPLNIVKLLFILKITAQDNMFQAAPARLPAKC